MATPQELYDETKTRLDLNIAKAQMLEREIQEDQGAIKQLEKLSDVVQTVESK